MAITLRQLRAEVKLDGLRQFEGDLDRSVRAVQSWGQRVRGAINLVSKAVAVAEGFANGFSAVTAFTGDNLLRLSSRLNFTTQQFTRMGFAAKSVGTSIDDLNNGLNILRDNVIGAASGNQELIQTFALIGIQITDQFGRLLPLSTILTQVVRVLNRIPDPAVRSAIALRLFGASGEAMLPFLELGVERMRELGQLSDDLGITLDQQTAQGAREFATNLRLLGTELLGIIRAIGFRLLPLGNDTMVLLLNLLSNNRDFITSGLLPFIDRVVSVLRFLRRAVLALVIVGFRQAKPLIQVIIEGLTTLFQNTIPAVTAAAKKISDFLDQFGGAQGILAAAGSLFASLTNLVLAFVQLAIVATQRLFTAIQATKDDFLFALQQLPSEIKGLLAAVGEIVREEAGKIFDDLSARFFTFLDSIGIDAEARAAIAGQRDRIKDVLKGLIVNVAPALVDGALIALEKAIALARKSPKLFAALTAGFIAAKALPNEIASFAELLGGLGEVAGGGLELLASLTKKGGVGQGFTIANAVISIAAATVTFEGFRRLSQFIDQSVKESGVFKEELLGGDRNLSLSEKIGDLINGFDQLIDRVEEFGRKLGEGAIRGLFGAPRPDPVAFRESPAATIMLVNIPREEVQQFFAWLVRQSATAKAQLVADITEVRNLLDPFRRASPSVVDRIVEAGRKITDVFSASFSGARMAWRAFVDTFQSSELDNAIRNMKAAAADFQSTITGLNPLAAIRGIFSRQNFSALTNRLPDSDRLTQLVQDLFLTVQKMPDNLLTRLSPQMTAIGDTIKRLLDPNTRGIEFRQLVRQLERLINAVLRNGQGGRRGENRGQGFVDPFQNPFTLIQQAFAVPFNLANQTVANLIRFGERFGIGVGGFQDGVAEFLAAVNLNTITNRGGRNLFSLNGVQSFLPLQDVGGGFARPIVPPPPFGFPAPFPLPGFIGAGAGGGVTQNVTQNFPNAQMDQNTIRTVVREIERQLKSAGRLQTDQEALRLRRR